MMPVKKIIIVEPHSIGHRMVYVRYILDYFNLLKNYKVILFLSFDSYHSFHIKNIKTLYSDFLTIIPIEFPKNNIYLNRYIDKIVMQINFVRCINKAIRSNKIVTDHIFIPFFDDYIHYVSAIKGNLFHGISFSGIYVNPRFHHKYCNINTPSRLIDYLDKFIFSRNMRNKFIKKLFSIDNYLNKFSSNNKIVYIPDPADNRARLENVHKKIFYFQSSIKDKIVILVYGYIDKRKGIDIILDILESRCLESNIVFIIAGTQSLYIKNLMDSCRAKKFIEAGIIIQLDRFITNIEETALFDICDIVWCIYPNNFFSSGAFIRAGNASKPTLSLNQGLMGRLIDSNGMGLVVLPNSIESIVSSILILSKNKNLRNSMGDIGYNFFKNNTPFIFSETIVKNLFGSLENI